MPITLEEAVKKVIAAREDWAVALMTVAVVQYKQELAIKLGKLAFLLDADEVKKNKSSVKT